MKPEELATVYADRYLLQDLQPIGTELNMMDIKFTQSLRMSSQHKRQSVNRKPAARGRGKSAKDRWSKTSYVSNGNLS